MWSHRRSAVIVLVVLAVTATNTCHAFVPVALTSSQNIAGKHARAASMPALPEGTTSLGRPRMAAANRSNRRRQQLFASPAEPSPAADERCDVLIMGSGPAARAIATLLSSSKCPDGSPHGLDVLMADANFDRAWPPNYGVWEDEWDAINDLYQSFGRTLGDNKCVDRYWPLTDCYFGGSFNIPAEERFRVDRPYCRIDKDALRDGSATV